MIQQLLNHIKRYNLFTTQQKILLAVSGGLDSMVMLHVMKHAGFQIGVAHCNFQLRGEASDGDETFVKEIASENNLPFFVHHFETEKYAQAGNISIQMAARELRYDWFEQLCLTKGFDVIATAHHLNDALETLLLNLTRGTGLDGIGSIPVKSEKVVRPILFATRQDLERYAKQHKIQWREDASNHSEYYQRNLIRKQVIPVLTQINPNLGAGFLHTWERLNAGRLYGRAYIEKFHKEATHTETNKWLINTSYLEAIEFPAVMLWELLKEKGFGYEQCCNVVHEQHQVGAMFLSATHQLVVDRMYLIITTRTVENLNDILIDDTADFISRGTLQLHIHRQSYQNFLLERNHSIAQLDKDKLHFPLRWRSWADGDRFIPLGMTSYKKISDFLIDTKISRSDKSDITVLESHGEIVWVVGHRIAEPFKVTENTKEVIIMKL